MQATFLAPELSATSRTVVVWIMALRLHLGLDFGLDEDLRHAPALLLRHRARLDDADLVARLGRLVLVVALVLLLLGHVLAVLAVLHAALDLDDHGLGHPGREHGPDAGFGLAAIGVRLLGILAHDFVSAGFASAALGAAAGFAVLRAALLELVFCVSSVRMR